MLRPIATALSAQCKILSRWSHGLESASGQCSLRRRSVIYITISASGHKFTLSNFWKYIQKLKSNTRPIYTIH